jgi:hypothetical protein
MKDYVLFRYINLFSSWWPFKDIYFRFFFKKKEVSWFCLFICFESHEQFFSYLATVTIAGDRAANLDLCLALTAFSSEGSFMCNTYCDKGTSFLRSYPKDPWFYLLNAVLLAKKQSLPILNVLGLTRPARAGLELMTYRLLSESTTSASQLNIQNDNNIVHTIGTCLMPVL